MRELPVGYFDFSKDEALNFQLNRFYSSGTIEYAELMEIGQRVKGFEEWVAYFTTLGDDAQSNGNFLKAAQCYRAAQFYTLGEKKDKNGIPMKKVLYEKCRSNYDRVYDKVAGLNYERIPYQNSYLPVYYMKQKSSRKTIVIHGGYDSFVQEFMEFVFFFYEKGYDVFFFEGPGQGEALLRGNLKMTSRWEECTSAVLDYFSLNNVTLIGISLGGYLALRAAAYDKRITGLILYDLIYDFYGSLKARMGKTKGRIFDQMTKNKNHPLWKMVNKKMDNIYFTKWLLQQGYEIYENVHTPFEYFNHIKQYNTRKISSLITQDTLVLAGERDIYTIYYQNQLDALVNAKSVTGRIFTKEESADHHCQIGNLMLVLRTMEDWQRSIEE
ncbi:MAG: alpha/beta hydrolase [Lachnospiraceae bacterium]|nr:alpha/beta hydrolase [Lachnospiraceae bacterium]